MDSNLHNNDFERMLKLKVEEFKMYPSKRIWHSIYNNVHPSKTWPSVAMSIIMFVSLIVVGYLNTTYNHKPIANLTENTTNKLTDIAKLINEQPTNYRNSTELTLSFLSNINEPQNSKEASTILVKQNSFRNHLANKDFTKSIKPGLNHANNEKPETLIITHSFQDKNQHIKLMMTDNESTSVSSAKNSQVIAVIPQNNISQTDLIENQQSESEKAFMDNYALYNKPLINEFKNGLALQLYVSPSVVYRKLTNKGGNNNSPENNPLLSNNPDYDKYLSQKPSIGFEAGASIQYPLSKYFRFKTGLQFNFTRYNSMAFENSHSFSSSITLSDPESDSRYEVYKSTSISNTTGDDPVKLHNETYQLSIPVGADFQIVGDKRLQWHVGATIQPTFVFNGQYYLPSSNGTAYIKDLTYLNRWNLNAGIETFISYNLKGITWQIGPEYRRQLFTTNNKNYFVNEKLYNYGIKLGITKLLH